MADSITTALLDVLFKGAHPSSKLYSLARNSLNKEIKTRSLHVSLQRLKNKKFIHAKNNLWYITDKGTAWYQKKQQDAWTPDFMTSPFSNKAPKDLLVIFDIPERVKYKRDWLREQLKIFGYEMIQRSVWIGPSPLPHSFTKTMNDLGLRDNVKQFRIRK